MPYNNAVGSFCRFVLVLFVVSSTTTLHGQNQNDPIFDWQVRKLLENEPMTIQNWQTWRLRLYKWAPGVFDYSQAAFAAGREFVRSHSNEKDELPPPLSTDPMAYYLLAGSLAERAHKETESLQYKLMMRRAELIARKSVAFDPTFAYAHRLLGWTFVLQSGDNRMLLQDAQRSFFEAKQRDQLIEMAPVYGDLHAFSGNYVEADKHYRSAFDRFPENEPFAWKFAYNLLNFNESKGDKIFKAQLVVKRFPKIGGFYAIRAAVYARFEEYQFALEDLKMARELNVNPADIIGAETVANIEIRKQPAWLAYLYPFAMSGVIAYGALVTSLALFHVYFRRVRGRVLAKGAEHPFANDKLFQAFDNQKPTVPSGPTIPADAGDDQLTLLDQIALQASFKFLKALHVWAIVLIVGAAVYVTWVQFEKPGLLNRSIATLYLVCFSLAVNQFRILFGATERKGLLLTNEQAPELWEIVRSTRDRLGLPDEPLRIRLLDDNTFAEGQVRLTGIAGFVQGRKKSLYVGWQALQNLSINELQAMIAGRLAMNSLHADSPERRLRSQILSLASSLSAIDAKRGALGALGKADPFFWGAKVISYLVLETMAPVLRALHKQAVDKIKTFVEPQDLRSAALKVSFGMDEVSHRERTWTLDLGHSAENIEESCSERKMATTMFVDAIAVERQLKLAVG